MEPTKAIKLDANHLEQLHTSALEQSLVTKERLARSLMRLKKESTTRLHVKNYTTILSLLLKICEEYESKEIYNLPFLHSFLLNIKNIVIDLIDYLDQRFPSFVPGSTALPGNKLEADFKIRTNLSVDQLGLILRAAYDQGVIITKSLNNLFRTLSPFFTSSERQQLSYSSMRSKSYSAEIKDKESTVAVLGQMVEAIKNY
ncbi:MAG TPA: hypothetical protein PK682_11250 [Niabella sp.]|nr:hypothetical protein [Niabella sp.]HQX21413.1 hypothetical protein [Niabella sp.]HQX73337.1 hypothetical protein [Chitinophagaceae bacterium]HRB36145.1 hypothetical protein [Niabella sp.]